MYRAQKFFKVICSDRVSHSIYKKKNSVEDTGKNNNPEKNEQEKTIWTADKLCVIRIQRRLRDWLVERTARDAANK